MTKPSYLVIGSRQVEWVEWAHDPMAHMWTTDEGTWHRGMYSECYRKRDLPELISRKLVVGHVPDEILIDMIERLETQAENMIGENGDDILPVSQLVTRLKAWRDLP